MAAAFSMLTMGVCSDLALCDVRKEAAIGEKMDLLHGLAFLGRRVWVEADCDYAISKVQSVCLFAFSDALLLACSSGMSHTVSYGIMV